MADDFGNALTKQPNRQTADYYKNKRFHKIGLVDLGCSFCVKYCAAQTILKSE